MNASNIRMELTAQIEQQLNQFNEDELAFVNKYVCMLFRRIRSSASAEAVGNFCQRTDCRYGSARIAATRCATSASMEACRAGLPVAAA